MGETGSTTKPTNFYPRVTFQVFHCLRHNFTALHKHKCVTHEQQILNPMHRLTCVLFISWIQAALNKNVIRHC